MLTAVRTSPRTRRQAALLAVAGLAMTPVIGACTGDGEPEPGGGLPRAPVPTTGSDPPTTGSDAPRLVVDDAPMRARVVGVGGNLSATQRSQVKDDIAETVGRWFDSAYLDGDLARADLAAAFEVFTASAAQQAARQADVTTGRVLAAELGPVVPTTRSVEAAVFAPGRGPAGATAQVTLVLVGARPGGAQVEQVVRGELYLTATAGGWRVFGFDLSRSVAAVGSFARSENPTARR